ncbi:MAG: EpsI family protein [Halioglobus sp.]|nr:EpsI family protein [Halioglobus sp.]
MTITAAAVVGVVVQFSDGSFDFGEVIGSSTLFAWDDSPWRVIGRDKIRAGAGLEELTVDEAVLRGPRGHFVAWSWYQLGDVHTSNDYLAKFQQAAARFGIGGRGTWRILLVTPARAVPEEARDSLRSFLRRARAPRLTECAACCGAAKVLE